MWYLANRHVEYLLRDFAQRLTTLGSLLNEFHFISQENSYLFECELNCVPEIECRRHAEPCLRLILTYHNNYNSNNKRNLTNILLTTFS